MNKLIRRTIYFLLTTLVINAGGWTFNKEAVADVWFDEQQNCAVVNEHSADPEVSQSVSHAVPCNHWCHAIGHFVGLHSQMSHSMLVSASEYSNQQSVTIQFYSPDSRFRPPRFLS